MKPKILIYDIETSPNLGYTWEKFDQNVIEFKKEWELLCFAYKWLGEKSVKCVSRPDCKWNSEEELVKKLHSLLSLADVTIAHNGDAFDNRKANAKFIQFGLNPPKPRKTVDTYKVAKKYFKFTGNRLDDVGKILGVGRKMQVPGFSLWTGCMEWKKESWKLMKAYNKTDVSLLEKVYLKLRPWIENHPNVALMDGRPENCDKCGSKRVQRNQGFVYTKKQAYRYFQCRDCGGFARATTAEKRSKS